MKKIILASISSVLIFGGVFADDSTSGTSPQTNIGPISYSDGSPLRWTICSFQERGTKSRKFMGNKSQENITGGILYREGLTDSQTINLVGATTWNNNLRSAEACPGYNNPYSDKNITPKLPANGSWSSSETTKRDNFRKDELTEFKKYFNGTISAKREEVGGTFSNISFNMNFTDIKECEKIGECVQRLQSYISWRCGLPLALDGKIGIKTLNAIGFCKPLSNVEQCPENPITLVNSSDAAKLTIDGKTLTIPDKHKDWFDNTQKTRSSDQKTARSTFWSDQNNILDFTAFLQEENQKYYTKVDGAKIERKGGSSNKPSPKSIDEICFKENVKSIKTFIAKRCNATLSIDETGGLKAADIEAIKNCIPKPVEEITPATCQNFNPVPTEKQLIDFELNFDKLDVFIQQPTSGQCCIDTDMNSDKKDAIITELKTYGLKECPVKVCELSTKLTTALESPTIGIDIKNTLTQTLDTQKCCFSRSAETETGDGKFVFDSIGGKYCEDLPSTTAGTENTKPARCVPIPGKCNCGIKLNTVVPFIGNCIEFGNTNDTYDSQYGGSDETIVVNSLNAFPILTGGLTRIGLVILLVSSLLLVISGGVLIASSGREGGNYGAGKDMIRKVVMGIAAIGASGVILNLINPSFFS